VSRRKQESILARTHEGEPGLPRGRSGLPAEEVRAAQRERLLGSVIAAVARSGFADATVADIVRGARVSKAAFYAHFADKEACFLAATSEGGRLMIDGVAQAARAVAPGAGAADALRAGIAAFLDFLAREPDFARAFYIDMPAAGQRAERQIRHGRVAFARANAHWHQKARLDHPDWPQVPEEAYYALAGATAELVRARVSQNRIGSLPGLEDTLVALHLAVLAGQPWPQATSRQLEASATSG
jgi:AcrR family transcriptional regulator